MKMNIGLFHISAVIIVFTVIVTSLQAASGIKVVYDFTSELKNADIQNQLDAAVRTPGKSGGVAMRSIFLHPKGAKDTRATFSVNLPKINDGEKLVAFFHIGVSDGAKLNDPVHPFNGIGFGFEVSGERVFSGSHNKCSWIPVALDMSKYSGRQAQLTLITNSNGGGNINYDWALFGEPRILRLEGNALNGDTLVGRGTVGIVACEYELNSAKSGRTSLKIEPLDDAQKSLGDPLVADMRRGTPQINGARLLLMEFDFSKIEKAVSFRISPPTAVKIHKLTAHLYQPELLISKLSASPALIFQNQPFKINCVVENVGKAPLQTEHLTRISIEIPEGLNLLISERKERDIKSLVPGANVRLTWQVESSNNIRARRKYPVKVEINGAGLGKAGIVKEKLIYIAPPLPELPQGVSNRAEAIETAETYILQNPFCRLVLLRETIDGEESVRHGLYYVRKGDQWLSVATSPQLLNVIYSTAQDQGRVANRTGFLHEVKSYLKTEGDAASILLSGKIDGERGISLHSEMEFRLAKNAKRIWVRYTLSSDKDVHLLRFGGPTLCVGDGSTGATKRYALFPGLEYLKDDEPSSSTRDAAPPINLRVVPQPYKVTVPLMAVQTKNALVGIIWNQLQKWDGKHYTVSAKFASPNFADAQDNHLLSLFLPTVPEWIEENEDSAIKEPYQLKANQKLALEAEIILDADGEILDALDHYYDAFGLPEPQRPPRDFQAELALCRYGFMHTVWDTEKQAARHCVGWGSANAPGFATLLWYNAHLIEDDNHSRKEVLNRVRLIAEKTLRESGPAGLVSTHACHILRWEFPFYYGHLEGGLEGARAMAYSAMKAQKEDGSWRFYPDARRKNLGKAGDSVIGICAHGAFTVLKYARITGDPKCSEAGLKALKFMNRFRIPRGAQGWECPIYEPDILASAWAVGAYVEGYRLTGDRALLERARYWARTGLPFLFAWNHPDRPAMLYASIPVFGTSFFTHSWFGVPVQWNGLVYAYELLHLAEYDKSFPWKKIARGITISGMWQQFDDEKPELKGTYPDGFYKNCTFRAAPYINPEDILVNVLTLRGHDPDISTQIVTVQRKKVHVSSGARVESTKTDGDALSFRLSYFPGEASYTLVTDIPKPSFVKKGDRTLAQTAELSEADEGWSYNAEKQYLFIKARHDKRTINLAIGR